MIDERLVLLNGHLPTITFFIIRPMGYEQYAGSFVVVFGEFFLVFDGFLVTGGFVITGVVVVLVGAFVFFVVSFVAAVVCFFTGGFTANIVTLSQFINNTY